MIDWGRELMVRRKSPAIAEHPLRETDLVTVDIEWDDHAKAWVTSVRELGLSDFGDSIEEALDHTAAAIAIYLEVLIQDHHPLPLPRDQAERLIALCRPCPT